MLPGRYLTSNLPVMVSKYMTSFVLRKLAHAINRIFLSFKKLKILLKNINIFFLFCSKHILWVHVRTAKYPQSMFWSKNKKKTGIPLHTPVLLYKKGSKGVYITRTCFPDDKVCPEAQAAHLTEIFNIFF